MPACKVAAEDPEGAFPSGIPKSGLEGVEEEEAGCCGQGGGLDIVSDTTLLTPRICQMSEMFSSRSADGGGDNFCMFKFKKKLGGSLMGSEINK
jgi:hypothetical protein